MIWEYVRLTCYEGKILPGIHTQNTHEEGVFISELAESWWLWKLDDGPIRAHGLVSLNF